MKQTDVLKLIVESSRKLAQVKKDRADLELRIKGLKAMEEALEVETIPDLMRQADINSLELGNGYEIRLEPFLHASLPSQGAIEKASDEEREDLLGRLQDGLAWLRKNKGGDIIRQQIKVELGKGADKAAKQFSALASKLNMPFERSETVHTGSLAKFLREKLADGAIVPFETFNIHTGQKAEITDPKGKKLK